VLRLLLLISLLMLTLMLDVAVLLLMLLLAVAAAAASVFSLALALGVTLSMAVSAICSGLVRPHSSVHLIDPSDCIRLLSNCFFLFFFLYFTPLTQFLIEVQQQLCVGCACPRSVCSRCFGKHDVTPLCF
jgi:hypothetical protein